VVKHGLISAVEISTLLCLIGLLISKPLPTWLNGQSEIRADASNYFFVFALMLPFSQLNGLCAAFLQCSGDMITPSVLNALMCLLDVVFNALFIPRFGVLGAGIGTTLACVVISIVMFSACCIFNKSLSLKNCKRNKFDFEIIKKAFKIGMPVAVQETAMCGAMVVSTAIIAPLGAVAVAANSFAITAESLCYMPGYGIGSAATTVVGRSYGSGDKKLAKRYGNICTALGGIFMGFTGLIMAIICPFVFTLLTPDLSVRNLATEVLRIGLLAEPLFGVSIVAAGALCGAGDTLVPSLMNLGSIWGVRIVLALILVKPFGLYGMWLAMAIELCVRGILMLWRQKTSKYYKHT
jgi:putative MATE family efflux protein